MNDLYNEILVKRKRTTQDNLIMVGLIALAALLAFVGLFMIPVVLIAAMIAVAACIYIIPGLNKEYEYLYVNGDFDIDLIRAKQRRKRVASYSIDQLEMVAPSTSHELDSYRQRSGAVVKNFTSLEENVPSVTLVYQTEKATELVMLEIGEDIIKDLRRLAPRKISRECLMLR